MSIWRNDLNQPLVVLRGASRNVVADIAWSRNCQYLMFASGEGVVAVEFDEAELGGQPISESELYQRREKMDQRKRLSMLETPEGISNVAPQTISQPISLSVPSVAVSQSPTSAPVTAPKPVVSAPQPPASTVAQSVVSTPQPVTSTPQPITSTSQPVTSTPQPITSTPQPVTSTPQPIPPTLQQSKASQTRKRAVESEEPVTRKRKKQQPVQPSSEPPSLSSRLCFPARALKLPAVVPLQAAFPGTEISLSIQVMPVTGSEEMMAFLQAIDSSGNPQWSWLGQGRPVLVSSSSHLIVMVSQEGLLYILSTDGRTRISPLQLTGIPSAIAVHSSASVDRVAALTTEGSLTIWEISSTHPLQRLVQTDAVWMLQEEVSSVSLQFQNMDAIEVTVPSATSALFAITAGTWVRPDLPLFTASPYSRSAPTLAIPVTSNPVLTTLLSFTQLESDLFRFRVLTPDRSQYERCLSMYAGLISDHKDLRRLRSLTAELKSCCIFV